VTPSQARNFLASLTPTLSNNTKALTLVALRGFYDEMIALGILPGENPFKHPIVKLARGATRPIRPTEAMRETDAQLLLSLPNRIKQSGKRDYALLCLLFGSGLRLREALRLSRDDLYLNSTPPRIRLYGTKTASMEEISISPWVAEALQEYIATHAMHEVFKLSSVGAWKIFKSYCKRAGLEGRYSPHSARCTSINILYSNGTPISKIKLFSRHSSTSSLERYLRETDKINDNPGLGLTIGGNHAKV